MTTYSFDMAGNQLTRSSIFFPLTFSSHVHSTVGTHSFPLYLWCGGHAQPYLQCTKVNSASIKKLYWLIASSLTGTPLYAASQDTWDPERDRKGRAVCRRGRRTEGYRRVWWWVALESQSLPPRLLTVPRARIDSIQHCSRHS